MSSPDLVFVEHVGLSLQGGSKMTKKRAKKPVVSEMPTGQTVQVLAELNARRIMTVRACTRLVNQALAFIRRYIWAIGDYGPFERNEDGTMGKEEKALREKICKQAKMVRVRVEKGLSVLEKQRAVPSLAELAEMVSVKHNEVLFATVPKSLKDVARETAPFVLSARHARKPIQQYRGLLERQMEKLAKTLPIWPWWSKFPGLGALGLAQVIAESGPRGPWGYSTPAPFWKRFGLGLVDGKIQQKVKGKDEASRVLAIKMGYCGRRNSEAWNIADAYLNTHATAKKEGRELKPDDYLQVYRERKEYELQHDVPEWHAHKRAKRYMVKRLFKDFLEQWKLCTPAPAASESIEDGAKVFNPSEEPVAVS